MKMEKMNNERIITSHIGYGAMTITSEAHKRVFPCLPFIINEIKESESGYCIYGTQMCGINLEVVGNLTIEDAVITVKDFILKEINNRIENSVPLRTLLYTSKDMERLMSVYTDLSLRKHCDFTTKQAENYRIAYAVVQDAIIESK